MRAKVYYTDNAAACPSCQGTIAEYTTNDAKDSTISVLCMACGSRDAFTPGGFAPETAAEISAAHHGSRT
jgi:transcription elongation factor Elf1